MVKFFRWLLGKLGYEVIEISAMAKYRDKLEYQQTQISDLTRDRDHYKRLAHDHKVRIDSVEFQTMEQWKTRIEEQDLEMARQQEANTAMEKKIKEGLAFYRTVEKRLSEVLHTSDEFGFPSGQTFPGSICGQGRTIRNIDGKEYVVVDGRGVLPEEIFDQIKAETNLARRYSLALSCLGRYKMFDNILRSIISNGGIEFTLGYNGENQTYELYYRLLCCVPEADTAIVLTATENGQYLLDETNKEEG